MVKAVNSIDMKKNYYLLDFLTLTKIVTDDLGKYSYGQKELDEDINLYYFNARFYDATTGRFINVDPVQDGTNWYVYCSNNPLSMVDPTGLREIEPAIITNDMQYDEETDSMVDMVTVEAGGTEKFGMICAVDGSTSADGSAGEDGVALGKGTCDVTFTIEEQNRTFEEKYDIEVKNLAGIGGGIEGSVSSFYATSRQPSYKSDQEIKESWNGPFHSWSVTIPTVVDVSYTKFGGDEIKSGQRNWKGSSAGLGLSVGKSIPFRAMTTDYKINEE